MESLLIDHRDQDFILYEMLNLESLCSFEKYSDQSRDVYEMILKTARKLAEEEIFPTLQEGDREGCSYENGNVKVPASFHKLKDLFNEGGWGSVALSSEVGGMGLPYTMYLATMEYFETNFAFSIYPYLGVGAAHLIEKFGNEEQQRKYMDNMIAGKWGGTMALTESEAGSDVGSLKTKAIPQPDGTYRIVGSKIFITGADSDLYENIVNPVLARIEGDPSGTKGISIFLVPKYLVNDDGSLGERNDYVVTGIEHKMGLKASATCSVSFGDNGNCYAELLGEERKGMNVMFQLMNEARIGVGIQGISGASMAYLHALNYAKERFQGVNIMQSFNPDAKRVPIIEHPDVRRMLLWMKSHVEGMRALVYYAGMCMDKERVIDEDEESERLKGIMEVLTPIIKSFCSDMGFRVTELAIQIYGGAGYCQDHPIEQFMRDMKIASIYEGTNGIQALDLVGRKLGMKKGRYFITLLTEMKESINTYKEIESLKDLHEDVDGAVLLLEEMGGFFGDCMKEGKFLIPVSNAVPFLNLMGITCVSWMLFWQAGIAATKMKSLSGDNGIDVNNIEAVNNFCRENSEAAFFNGKVHSARYYIKNVLPEIHSLAIAIKSGDTSVTDIDEACF